MSANFFLEKWYMDCINDLGRYCIGYHADLRFLSQSLSYSALLTPNNTKQKQVFSRSYNNSLNYDGENGLVWKVPKMSLTAIMNQQQRVFEKVLFENIEGKVVWTCVMPLANAHFTFEDNDVKGLGYAEKLLLTIPPWKLPIKELIWGRWCAYDKSIVWIEWRGEYPFRLIIEDGIEVQPIQITDHEIVTETFSLTLNKQCCIRDGKVVNTVLQKVPILNKVLPEKARGLYESKWLSRGIFRSGKCVREAWAIHEKVEW